MQAFNLHPSKTKPIQIIASIPHTGTYVPEDIDSLFISDSVRQLPMTDWFLHHLYDFLPNLGVSVIAANYSRYVIDLNRSPKPLALYPGRFETCLVADKDFQGETIFSTYPSDTQIDFYKATVHLPYHTALNSMLEDRLKEFETVYLFDLHSIAKTQTVVHAELTEDIYLGNRDANSCSNAWLQLVERELLKQKLSVQKNKPYKGGYITHHYGLNEKIEALQIEMNQSLYLPEVVIENKHQNELINSHEFISTKNKLKIIFDHLIKKITE